MKVGICGTSSMINKVLFYSACLIFLFSFVSCSSSVRCAKWLKHSAYNSLNVFVENQTERTLVMQVEWNGKIKNIEIQPNFRDFCVFKINEENDTEFYCQFFESGNSVSEKKLLIFPSDNVYSYSAYGGIEFDAQIFFMDNGVFCIEYNRASF